MRLGRHSRAEDSESGRGGPLQLLLVWESPTRPPASSARTALRNVKRGENKGRDRDPETRAC